MKRCSPEAHRDAESLVEALQRSLNDKGLGLKDREEVSLVLVVSGEEEKKQVEEAVEERWSGKCGVLVE